MHLNELLNVKARFETLYKVNLNDKVVKEGKISTLGDLVLSVKDNKNNLFLTAEKGAGKNSNDVNIVLNPKVKNKARK